MGGGMVGKGEAEDARMLVSTCVPALCSPTRNSGHSLDNQVVKVCLTGCVHFVRRRGAQHQARCEQTGPLP